MTDLNPEIIEQGRKALTFGIMGCGQCCGENPPDELDHLDFDVARAHVAARAALEAVVPAIMQAAKAEALRDAAGWFGENQMIREGDAKAFLRDLAGRIERGES